MAFAQSGLRKIAEGLFVYYAAADTAATVQASGYFNTPTKQLKQDDVIIVIGNTRASVDVCFVSSADNATTVTTVGVEGVTAT
jgi:hypothetical protein